MFFLPPFESSREGLRGDFVELRASSAGISGWNAEGVLSLSEARNPEGASSFCGCKGRIPSLLGGLCVFAFEGPYDIMWWRCSKETNAFFCIFLVATPVVFFPNRFSRVAIRRQAYEACSQRGWLFRSLRLLLGPKLGTLSLGNIEGPVLELGGIQLNHPLGNSLRTSKRPEPPPQKKGKKRILFRA